MNDTFSKLQKQTIWNNFFGENKNSGQDPFGINISRDNFEADHIWPVAEGGKTRIENGMPLHHISNLEKGDDMSGQSNGKNFQVQGTKSKGVLKVDEIAYDYKGKR